MWNDDSEIIQNFYAMTQPDPKYMKDRMKKVQAIIEKMGNTYCLAVPVKKLKGAQRVRL